MRSAGKKPRRYTEDQIQATVADHLRLRSQPDVVWFHPPNGGFRNLREAVRLKRQGVIAGVSDLIFLHRGHAYAMELKAPGGRPTESQLLFQSRWRDAGGFAFVAEGLDEAIAGLEAWGFMK